MLEEETEVLLREEGDLDEERRKLEGDKLEKE